MSKTTGSGKLTKKPGKRLAKHQHRCADCRIYHLAKPKTDPDEIERIRDSDLTTICEDCPFVKNHHPTEEKTEELMADREKIISAFCQSCPQSRHSRLVANCEICGHPNVKCGYRFSDLKMICEECCIEANTCIECGETIKV